MARKKKKASNDRARSLGTSLLYMIVVILLVALLFLMYSMRNARRAEFVETRKAAAQQERLRQLEPRKSGPDTISDAEILAQTGLE